MLIHIKITLPSRVIVDMKVKFMLPYPVIALSLKLAIKRDQIYVKSVRYKSAVLSL